MKNENEKLYDMLDQLIERGVDTVEDDDMIYIAIVGMAAGKLQGITKEEMMKMYFVDINNEDDVENFEDAYSVAMTALPIIKKAVDYAFAKAEKE